MRTLVLIGCSLLLSTTALSSEKLTAERYVRQVLDGPAAEVIAQEVDLAEARSRGAGLWRNPSVSWNRQSLPGSGVAQSTEDIVWLSVPLVLSGRTFAESSAAEDGVKSARLLSVSRRADLRRQAMVLFYRAVAAEQRRAVIEETRSRFADVSEILETRAAAGETSGYDALRLEMEATTIEDRAAGALLDLASAKAEMQKLSGAAVEALDGALVPAAPKASHDGSPLASRLQALELQVKAARSRASAGRRRAIPDPTIGAGVLHQGGEGLPGFTGYYVGVQVPLPLFDRGQGASATEEATASRLELERQRLLAVAEASLAEARRRLEVSRDRLAKQSENAKRGESLVEIARKGYGLGGVGLLTLLDAERSALDARLRATERALDVRRAEADVAFLTGAYDEGNTR
ncbi:MAG: TolC family protein [Deltaproteobacteria bacterium]|jgi:cobalt-zinc-cadmium efflux system outer membrane protein